jgi:DNA polymerase III delta prime subunit
MESKHKEKNNNKEKEKDNNKDRDRDRDRERDKRYEELPWTEKYRPSNIEELCLPQITKTKIMNIIKDKDMNNLIIVGPPGIGKTSIIKIIATELYGKYYKDAVLELGLLDDKCIKFMQNDNIQNFCKTKIPYKKDDENKYPKFKLIIFDEATSVQEQISNIMEDFKDYVRFAFTCNSSLKINEGIQTKSSTWRCTYLEPELITNKLIEICTKEKVKYTESSLKRISHISQGDLRSAINKLELIYNKYNQIKDEYIDELCSTPQELIIKQLFEYIINKNLKESLNLVFDLKKKSYSGSDITQGMLSTLKSNTCKNIPENIKIKLCNQICSGIYRISNITDSDLQLAGCVVDMIRCLD